MSTIATAEPVMIRSSWVCATHSVPVKFLEGSLNSAVGQLGSSSSPALRGAIIHGFTGASPYCSHCGDDLHLVSTGDSVDFLVICRSCDEPRAATEHKPLGANPTASVAIPEMYDPESYAGSVLVDSPILAAPTWTKQLTPHCATPHDSASCDCAHLRIPVRNVAQQGLCQLSCPQILSYAHTLKDYVDHITVINDRHRTASEIYEARKFEGLEFDLSQTVFPVITTEQVIVRLTTRLSRIRVPAADRPLIVAVVEAMARRAGILGTVDAGRWIRASARQCSSSNPACRYVPGAWTTGEPDSD